MPKNLNKQTGFGEVPIFFNDIIAMLSCSQWKFFLKHRKRMVEAGTIFYIFKGRPPIRKIAAYPSDIRRYVRMKARNGEML